MRRARNKVSSEEGPAIYHVYSRTVNGELLFGDVEREVFRRMLRQLADFTGTKIITWTILSNHFHVVAKVPTRVAIDDAELLRRYTVLYPKPTKYETAKIEIVRAQLSENGPAGQALRRRLLGMMYDLSEFLKLLKQRFSTWFNKSHDRFGPLWCDRFGSVLLEAGDAVRNVAAYVDLNCVRAGIVKDPAHYRFCGYGEAVVGDNISRTGIMSLDLSAQGDWNAAQAAYRILLFCVGSGAREHGAVIRQEEYRQVVDEGGHLALTARWACRVRHFSAGAVLGSRLFVDEHLARYRKRYGPSPRTRPRPTPLGDLMTLKIVRATANG